METVREAKAYLRKNWEEGCKCPCCGQIVKIYKRQIMSTMAYGLILAYRHFKDQPFHFETLWKTKTADMPYNTDFYKLEYWGLIERVDDFEKKYEGAKTNGMWRLTKKGIDFIFLKETVPTYKYIYNKIDVKEFSDSDKFIIITDALKNKFNYSELMKGL